MFYSIIFYIDSIVDNSCCNQYPTIKFAFPYELIVNRCITEQMFVYPFPFVNLLKTALKRVFFRHFLFPNNSKNTLTENR